MKQCMECKRYTVKNPDHDLCYSCWQELEEREEIDDFIVPKEVNFSEVADSNRIHTTYILFYEKNKRKIGYTSDLNARLLENKEKYSNCKLVYFREFSKESEARRYEAWLKEQYERTVNRLIVAFQEKIRKVQEI